MAAGLEGADKQVAFTVSPVTYCCFVPRIFGGEFGLTKTIMISLFYSWYTEIILHAKFYFKI